MSNEIIDTTNKLIKPEDVSSSDDDVIRQLSENLQDITTEDVDAMCCKIDETARRKKEEKEEQQKTALSKFCDYPGWYRMTGEEQVEVFTDLLKSVNFLSVQEKGDFYNISINIPGISTTTLCCTKKEYDINCCRKNPDGDFAKVKELDKKMKNNGFFRTMEADAEKISHDLLYLFDKLGDSNVSRDYYKMYYSMEYSWIWSFFAMFISATLDGLRRIKTSTVWFGDSYYSEYLNDGEVFSSAGTFYSNNGGRTESLYCGSKSQGRFEPAMVLYIKK